MDWTRPLTAQYTAASGRSFWIRSRGERSTIYSLRFHKHVLFKFFMTLVYYTKVLNHLSRDE